jgi:hypothetical protein
MTTSVARLAGGILLGLALASQSFAAPAAANGPAASADANHGWPRQFSSGGAALTVYQPQLDSWDGRRLQAHAAVSVRPQGGADSTFGVIWIAARTDVDKENRQVDFENVEISKASFPSAPGRESAYLEMFRQELPKRSRTIALDRLEASLAILEERHKAEALPLRNDPPRILFSKVPAILVSVDGPPVYRAIRGSSFERVLNTRPLLLRGASGVHYLHLFDGWMRAETIEGPWSVLPNPPAELARAADEVAKSKQPVDLLEGEVPESAGVPAGGGTQAKPSLAKGPVPAVFIATSPTELLVTEGEPEWTPVDGTDLLYVRNTTGNVFKDLNDQRTYILISGRWYSASSESGPWEYVPGGRLPAAFSKIPDDSPKENVKASVPDTPQAAEALIADDIPQTAKVDRKTQMTPPDYDGEPELAPIEGTPLQYVKNASLPVIVVDGTTWYAVEDGVWFVATSPQGPWKVAGTVPAVIYSIPPSSPLHYVTYVRVYDAWEDAVWEGYTPGYTGTVINDDGLVVYGTGYAYTPWIGSVWYAPPVTWGLGFGLAWTPWWGWSFGVGFGWGWGWSGEGWIWGCLPPPWWGPIGWGWHHDGWHWRGEGRQTRIVPWRPGGFPAAGNSIYRRWGPTARVSPRPAPSGSPIARRPIGLYGGAYNSRTGALAGGQRARVRNVYPAPGAAAPRVQPVRPRNDVYGDTQGRVYRRDERGNWRQVAPPSSRPPEPARVRPLEREHGAREMGERRSSGARAPAPRPSAPPPAPKPVAPRGGGRHR